MECDTPTPRMTGRGRPWKTARIIDEICEEMHNIEKHELHIQNHQAHILEHERKCEELRVELRARHAANRVVPRRSSRLAAPGL